MLTVTEENYLKAIYRLTERYNDSVSTNLLADEMQSRPASVTEMFNKLAHLKLIKYEKYYGAELTKEGRRYALQILRRHRLWEQFLVQVLGFKWDEVHEIAEDLEHIRHESLISKIDAYLGYPKSDPHGDPIPSAEGEIIKSNKLKLSEIKEGEEVTFLGVTKHTIEFLQYLDSKGFKLGGKLMVESVLPFDRSMTIKLPDSSKQYLSADAAEWLLVIR